MTQRDDPNDRVYPCRRCGKLRSKNEGGTTFTVCDECWDATGPAARIRNHGEKADDAQI
jgi:DNA-directed RNA polymerase subunit M/transcription elongation factor TFIIS